MGSPDVKDNRERLCGLCVSTGMIVANADFKYEDVHRSAYYRQREDRSDKSMIDMFLVRKKM